MYSTVLRFRVSTVYRATREAVTDIVITTQRQLTQTHNDNEARNAQTRHNA